ncbi:MAG: YolD-like family protein [Ruminococcus albus]|nr:YolD-like family protein [Ruminococcus albus]
MDRAERAKIFMPFASLKGYYDLILAQEDGHEVRRQVDDETAAKISDKLNRIKKGSSIKVEYYENGNYITEKGKVNRIDYSYKFLVVNDQKIWFDDIMDIEDYVPYGRETWL